MSNTINKPLVSAIISTYNSEFFIKGKIDDLLNQTIADNLEIIIVNSGSEQNETQIVKPYLDNHENIKYIETKQRETIYRAWNRGIKQARGKYITNANTDDRLRKDAYEVLADILINNPDIALVYADQYITNTPNEPFAQNSSTVIDYVPDFDPILQLDRCIVGSQPMWRASLHFEKDIWFDESFEVSGDHEFELNISQYYQMYRCKEVLGTFYKSKKTNKSFENMERNRDELRRLKQIYIPKYINGLTDDELRDILKKFELYVKMPIWMYLAYHKYKAWLNPYKTFFSLEFNYYFVASILKKLGETEKAKRYCEKYKSKKKSPIIDDLYATL